MKNEEKIELVNIIESYIKETTEKGRGYENIGYLNKFYGLNGFKSVEPGTPVFEDGERYFIYLETLDGKNNHRVNFYKETLKPAINFF